MCFTIEGFYYVSIQNISVVSYLENVRALPVESLRTVVPVACVVRIWEVGTLLEHPWKVFVFLELKAPL